jgi:hypothetical protein
VRTILLICATLIALGTGCGNCDGGSASKNNAAPGTHPTSITGARKQFIVGKLDLGLDGGLDQ